jgi:hypothetical protein
MFHFASTPPVMKVPSVQTIPTSTALHLPLSRTEEKIAAGTEILEQRRKMHRKKYQDQSTTQNAFDALASETLHWKPHFARSVSSRGGMKRSAREVSRNKEEEEEEEEEQK